MSSWEQWKDIERLAEAVRAQKPRLIHLVRDIWLHDLAPDRGLCPCKCGSRFARRTEIRPHLQVLIDRVTGERRVRRPHNAEAFDKVAALAQRLEMPLVCYAEQLDPILDQTHKAIGVFGGNRSGKSETGKEKVGDCWAEHGGRGVSIWWVAPTRDDTQIAVDKLVRGYRTNRFVKPLFPAELVRSWPKSALQQPQSIVLVDGTRIELKYAGKKGANLKGRTARLVVLDEGSEVRHEINYTILVNRTMDSGGQVIIPTTPVAGHWLKKLADEGTPYSALTPGEETERVTATLSCRRNPWIDPREVERTIRAFGGENDPRVRREVFGEWVAEGQILWRHFSPRRHMREGIGYAPEDFGFVNITPIATRHFLPRGCRNNTIGGWDCNDFPQSLILAFVVVARGESQRDPRLWKLFSLTEIVKRATIVEWGDYLANRAARDRGRPPDWLSGLAIVGDANTCYAETRVNRRGESSDADILREHGFVVVPPAWTQAMPDKPAKPKNPSIRDRIKLGHQLMHEDRAIFHGDCRKLLDAVEHQICDDRGLPLKESGKASDRLSGPADGWGYLAYRIWHGATPNDPQDSVEWD